jgi:hypothetical protein
MVGRTNKLKIFKYVSPQPPLPGIINFDEAVEKLSTANLEERGAIYTRREIVEFILDLSDYTSAQPLSTRRFLEPSFGEGDFLLVAVQRLLESYYLTRHSLVEAAVDLRDCIRGVELHQASISRTQDKLGCLLLSYGVAQSDINVLLQTWLVQGDFLLCDSLPFQFTHVAGNPPYVRQELVPDILMSEYRRRFSTIYDRADLYIPFIEKSLSLLSPFGNLGFICSDRWMKNRYGGPLRELIAQHYHLKYYVDVVDSPTFLAAVLAYPAITILSNEKPGPTRIANRPAINSESLSALARSLRNGKNDNDQVKEVSAVTSGSEPWIFESFDQLALVRRLEKTFPEIEETGCEIGIGVATGADRVFIQQFDQLDVETDRKIQLVTTDDIVTGTLKWQGKGILNPFQENGQLVDLRRYPRLANYFKQNETLLKNRHVARRNPAGWYRTIDRINPGLTTQPKLLIPDIKNNANIVFEEGHFYPHHNLYYMVSNQWDLRALRAVLMSGIARLFISVYSTKMQGGYLRFQAQYLRRIRIPFWSDVPLEIKNALITAAQSCDVSACNTATFDLFQLSHEERAVIRGNGESTPIWR